MKSRTSFFNLTALRKDITRFAPAWALYLIAGLLLGLTTLSSASNYRVGYAANGLASTISLLVIVNLVYAAVNVQLLFGDLFSSRLCNALHAFPLRRESWFATHTAAGLLFSIVPNLILSICFLPFLDGMWFISFLWLLGATLSYVFFFGLAVFSVMCTGSRFAMAAVYAILNFASMIVCWFVLTFYEPLLHGLHIREDSFTRFCPAVRAADQEYVKFEVLRDSSGSIFSMEYIYKGLTADWWYLAVIGVLGIALLGAALLLYRRRRLESAGDFVAFSWLKPIFSVVFTLSAGAVFELFGKLFVNVDYVFLAAGIVVGYFVSQMLLQRTVRVFRPKAFGVCAAIGGALVLSIGLTALDPFGITRWTPKAEKVETITLSSNYYYDPESDYFHNVITITNPVLIDELVQIHALIVENRDWEGSYSNSAVHLTYKMSDGRQVTRRYRYRSGQVSQRLAQFFSTPEFVLGYEDWETYLDSVKSVYVEGEEFLGQDAVALVQAIRADCEAGHMDQSRSTTPYSYVEISRADGYGVYLSVYYDCAHTIAWIKENL